MAAAFAPPARQGEPPLAAFFRGTGVDDEYRTLEQILVWDDQLLEVCHDYIQWLLPTDEPSRFNDEAPLLDEDLQQVFRQDPLIRRNLRRGLRRFLRFLGLDLRPGPEEAEEAEEAAVGAVTSAASASSSSGSPCRVVKAENFSKRILMCWRGPDNHNWRRLSRALRCLSLVGMPAELLALYRCLEEIGTENPGMIDDRTLSFWRLRAGVTNADGSLTELGRSLQSKELHQPGLKRRTSGAVPGGSLRRLREHFASVDADSSGTVSRAELHDYVRQIFERRLGSAPDEQVAGLFEEAVARCYAEIDLGLRGGLDATAWLHYVMLNGSAPSALCARNVNQRLRSALARDPEFLEKAHAAFEAHDFQGDGRLRPEHWQRALAEVGVEASPMADLDQNGVLDYFEFISHAVGIWPSKVELVVYNLAALVAEEGAASGSPHDVCPRPRDTWHTAVRAFGGDFCFAGDVIACTAEQGVELFGQPTRVEMLGWTQRTREELVQFIEQDLTHSFHRGTFDVLWGNSNEFAKEVVQYLLSGKQLPPELLEGPRFAPDLLSEQALSLLFSQRLERCLEGKHGEAFVHVPVADESFREWRSGLRCGDLVLHRHRSTDCPRIAKVVSAPQGDSPVVDLLALGPAPADDDASSAPAWSFVVELFGWAPVRLAEVPVQDVWPVAGGEAIPGA